MLEGLPYLCGKRGKFVVGLFAYLRWVDDVVDENNYLTRRQKLVFLERQMGIVGGFAPEKVLSMEETFSELPWECVPEKEVRHRVNIILGSVADDADHQGFKVRTDREVRHYNWRTIWPVVDCLFLVLNGKPMREDASMMRLLDAYMKIGSLEGLADDLQQGVVKLPMGSDCGGNTSVDEVLERYDERMFYREKVKNLREIESNLGAFMRLDIPSWQKFACIVYLGRTLLKKTLFMNRGRAVRGL